MTDHTLSERGYTLNARILAYMMTALSGVYTTNWRFVNSDEWNSPGKHVASFVKTDHNYFLEFERDHNTRWGCKYRPQDVKIDWHGAPLPPSQCPNSPVCSSLG
jgi:Proteasome-substrate-size regulator, mid region